MTSTSLPHGPTKVENLFDGVGAGPHSRRAMNIYNIQVGDIVKVVKGPHAGDLPLVLAVEETSNVYCPIAGHYGGPSLRIRTDLGTCFDFQLDPKHPVEVKGWATAEELAV